MEPIIQITEQIIEINIKSQNCFGIINEISEISDESTETFSDNFGEENEQLCAKCQNPIVQIDNNAIIDQQTLITNFNAQKSQTIQQNVYDFIIKTNYREFTLILLSAGKIQQLTDIQLITSKKNERFEEFEPEWMNQIKYAEQYPCGCEPHPICPSIGNSKAFRMKIATEISLKHKFEFPIEKLVEIFWDIETYTTDGIYFNIPKADDKQSFIGCIQFMLQYKQNGQKVRQFGLFYRSGYKFNINQIRERLEIDEQEQIIQRAFKSETQMCDFFIQNIMIGSNQFHHDLPKIMVGFNACSTISMNDCDKQNQADFSKKHEIQGYDLPFIVRRSSHILTPQNIQYKVSAEANFIITKGFKEIPQLYLHDAMPLFCQQMSADDLKLLPNKSLDSFLASFKIEAKKQHNYQDLQRKLHISSEDLTSEMEYALYDTICLQKVFESRDIVGKWAGEMAIWNVPLSFELYETANTKNQIKLARMFIEKKLMPAYHKVYKNPDEIIQDDPTAPKIKKRKFKGALTDVNEDYVLKVQDMVICHDFASLYPSVIVAFNISPETLVNNPETKFGENWREKVNIIDATDDPEIKRELYFLKSEIQEGILPMCCREFLDGRAEIKNKQKIAKNSITAQTPQKQRQELEQQIRVYENKQLAIKTANNTFFGGIGSDFNPFYKFEISASITAQARCCLRKLNEAIENLYGKIDGKTRIIANDTDSVFWLSKDVLQPQNKTAKQRKEQFEQIESQINEYLQSFFPKRISVCAEEIIVRYCAAKAKKSYYRLDQGLGDYFESGDKIDQLIDQFIQKDGSKLFKLQVKGVQWSSLNIFCRNTIKQFFLQHLYSKENIDQALSKHISEIQQGAQTNFEECRQKLKEIQMLDLDQESRKNNQLKAIAQIEQYCKRIRLSGKSNICKYINSTYPHIKNENETVFIVPLLYGKKASESVVPSCELQIQHFNLVDINKILDGYMSQINKFFIKKEEKTGKINKIIQELGDDFEEDQCLFRLEKKQNGIINRSVAIMTPEQASKFAQENKSVAVHEFITERNQFHKMFFDIDGTIQLDIITFKAQLQKYLSKQGVHHGLELYFATCHRKKKEIMKYSYHIISNIIVHRDLMKEIGNYMKQKYDKIDNKALDINIYKSGNQTSSLRFINSVKFEKDGQLMKNRFVTEFTAEQMSITQICDPSLHKVNAQPVLLKTPIFDFQNTKYITFSHQQILEPIKSAYPYLEIKQLNATLIIFKFADSYTNKCPICDKQHQSNDDGKVYGTIGKKNIRIHCHRNQNKVLTIPIESELTEEQKIMSKEFNTDICYPLEFIPTQNRKHVEFKFNNDYELLCVKSAMGSGKTENTIKIMKSMKKQSGIILSVRCLLTQDWLRRYKFDKDGNPTGIPICSYQDLEGSIDPTDGFTICQVESMERILDQPIELLVLDEYMSIYEQLNSKLARNQNALLYKFIRLLSQSKRILILDAQLRTSAIPRLEFYTERRARVEYNIYKPYTGHKMFIHKVTNKNSFDGVLKLTKQALEDGKQIYSHINSRKKLLTLQQSLLKDGFKARGYHGLNLLPDQNGKTHGQIKQEHFKDISYHFKQYNLVCGNGAMAQGIDFSEDHFDYGIHAFYNNSSSPMSFVQGIFRSRRFAEKEHHVFIQDSYNAAPTSTFQIFEHKRKKFQITGTSYCPINDKIFNLIVDLDAYKSAMKCNATNIIISNLKDLGCEIIYFNETEQHQQEQILTKIAEKELPPIKVDAKTIQNMTLERSTIKYFLETHKARQQMIINQELQANADKQIQTVSMLVTLKLNQKQLNIPHQYLSTEQKKLENEQFIDQSYIIINKELQELQKLGDQHIKNAILEYDLCRIYRPYKQAFGKISHLPLDDAIKLVDDRVKMSMGILIEKVSAKGQTCLEIQQHAEKTKMALKVVHAPDEETRSQIAYELFKYKECHFKFIYAILGLNFKRDVIHVKENKKVIRKYETNIMDLAINSTVDF